MQSDRSEEGILSRRMPGKRKEIVESLEMAYFLQMTPMQTDGGTDMGRR